MKRKNRKGLLLHEMTLRAATCAVLAIALVACIAIEPAPALAENSSRGCILFGKSNPCAPGVFDSQVVIPVGASNLPVADLEFEIDSPSNAIFHVALYYNDHTQPTRAPARYNLVIDGHNGYRLGGAQKMFIRTPSPTDGTSVFPVAFENIPTGKHVATLHMDNLSGSPIHLTGVRFTALFADSSEPAVVSQSTQWISVPGSWTTIATLTAPNVQNRRLYLSTFVRADNANHVDFRYTHNGTPFVQYGFDFHGGPDGVMFDRLYVPQPGATMGLQVKGPALIQVFNFVGQALKHYTVFGDVFGNQNQTVPNGTGNPGTTVASTGNIFLNSVTLDGAAPGAVPHQWEVCGWGYGMSSMSMSDSTETLMWLRILNEDGSPLFQDIGVQGQSPVPQQQTFYESAWGGCGIGLFDNRKYRVEQSIQGLCAGGSSINVHDAQFQVMILPAPDSDHTCSDEQGCDPGCTNECTFNSSLAKIPKPTRISCN